MMKLHFNSTESSSMNSGEYNLVQHINVGVDTQRQISFEMRWIQTAWILRMNTSISHLRSHIAHFEQQKNIKMGFNKKKTN
jgi:hypothetical protein